MAQTIRITSNSMIHAPGCFAHIVRAFKSGRKKDIAWAKEAWAAFGLAPATVRALVDGQAVCETDPEDKTVLLITVANEVYEAQAEFSKQAQETT